MISQRIKPIARAEIKRTAQANQDSPAISNILFKQEQTTTEIITQTTQPKIIQTIEPSLKEIERFLLFLNDKFELGLDFKDITILISSDTNRGNTKGYFMPKQERGFKSQDKSQDKTQATNIQAIVLNTLHLNNTPYETIAHELGHYYNNFRGIKDCSSNQYHNKHFKEIAERLLLAVEKMDNRGFAYTSITAEFLKMLEEFKPNEQAFKIFQQPNEKAKQKSRNFKATCDCGYIIRCGDKSLKAICENCNSKFVFEETE